MIIKAKKADLKEIARLMKTELAKPPFNERDKLESIIKSLKFYFKLGKIYIAKEKNEIIGVIVFKKEQFWEGGVIIIEDLVIKNEFRGKGIGKNLLDYVKDSAKKEKIKSILFTTNRKSGAIEFYKKLGYKIEKDKIYMRMDLK